MEKYLKITKKNTFCPPTCIPSKQPIVVPRELVNMYPLHVQESGNMQVIERKNYVVYEKPPQYAEARDDANYGHGYGNWGVNNDDGDQNVVLLVNEPYRNRPSLNATVRYAPYEIPQRLQLQQAHNHHQQQQQQQLHVGSNKSNCYDIPNTDASIKTTEQQHLVVVKSGGVETLSAGTTPSIQNELAKLDEGNPAKATGAGASTAMNGRRLFDASATPKSALDKQKVQVSSSGMRVFTGSTEKVLKWYKIIQDLKIDYVFEVIAKCINIKSGQGCEKHLLVRDSSGPVLQVVYYEIDFLLTNVEIGTTIRIVGKMTGANRMRAFKVRPAMAFEGAAVPRLSAIAQHVIVKLQQQQHSG